MKISFVNFGATICGGNRVLFEVANRLIQRGHEVEFYALNANNWFPLKAKLTVCKDVNDLQAKIPESDVLVATWCETAFIVDSFKGRKGVPFYYGQHYEPIFFLDSLQKEKVASTYDLPLNFIANSSYLKCAVETLHKRSVDALAIPGVDLNVFKPTKKRKFFESPFKTTNFGSVKKEDKPAVDGKGDKPLKILTFASATYFKGFYDVTLPAFNYVHKSFGEDVEFHFFGDPTLPIPFNFKVVKHGFVKDADLVELYNDCDLFVCGSHAESSPIALLEAVACGCPTVTSSLGAEDFPSAIIKTPNKAPRTLGNTIIMLLNDPETRRALSLKGLEEVKAFTWDATTDKVEQVFKEKI